MEMNILDVKLEESNRLYDEIMKNRFEQEKLMERWDALHDEIKKLIQNN